MQLAREKEGNRVMKEATHDDAVSIAHLLDVNKETVWEIIKGMKYSEQMELAMAVHVAFLSRPPEVMVEHNVHAAPRVA